MSDIFSKWEKTLNEIREKQLQPLLINRHIFRQFADCTEPYVGTTEAGALSGWMGECFVSYAFAAVRRTADRGRNIVSLWRFLGEVKPNCGKLFRERMRTMYPRGAEKKADEMFDFGIGPDRERPDCLSGRIVKNDITSLDTVAKTVTVITNRWIAHTSTSPEVLTLKFGELHNTIDEIQEMYSRYHALVTGNMPVWAPLEVYDCEADLQKIWVPK